MNPRYPWLWLFVAINLIAGFMMLSSGELIGDVAGTRVYSDSALLTATVLTVTSYLIILGPVYNFVSRIKVQPIKFGINEESIGQRLGLFVFFLQMFFLIFNFSTGVNIAGSSNPATDSPFAIVFVLLPADAMFLIYYGTCRESKYFYANLVIAVVSNLMRGWAGIFMIIIFMEWCRGIHLRKLKLSRVMLFGALIILTYPLLSGFKVYVRATAGADISVESLNENITTLLGSFNYIELIAGGLEHIIGRLQSISLLVEVMRLSELLQEKFVLGEFAPFWKEGLHGIFYDRLFEGIKQMYIGVAFTKYTDFNFLFEVGDWNVSLGYPSWFFIAPLLTPLYICYTLTMCFISFYLIKKIGVSMLAKDMIWFSWMVFLLAPWFHAFNVFIYSLCVFLAIKILFSKLPIITSSSSAIRLCRR